MTESTPVPRWFCIGCKRVVPEGEVNDHTRHTGLVSTPARGYSLEPCMGVCVLPIDGSVLYYDALYQQYNRFFPADKTIRLGVVPSDFWPDGLTYDFNRTTDAYTILGGGGLPSATNLPSLKAVKLRAMEMFQSASIVGDSSQQLMLDRIKELMCVQLEEWHEDSGEDLHDCIARVIRDRDGGASKVAAALSHPAADLAAKHMGARWDSSGGYEVCLSPSAVPGPSLLPGRCPRCNGTGVLLDTSMSPAEDVPCDRCDGRTFEKVAADWCADKVAQERERCLQEVRKTNWSLSCLSELEDRIIRGSK